MLANDLAFLPVNDDVPLRARVAVGEPKFLPIRTTQNDFVHAEGLRTETLLATYAQPVEFPTAGARGGAL
jgi:hypothetical protein